jgi:hypothetical protein
MKKRKLRKKIIIVIAVVVLLAICFFVGRKIYIKLNTFNIKIVDRIDNYPYILDDRDTEVFKTYFKELKSLLKESNIDNEKYAGLVAKLFIIDLYTLNNKVNKYDIGAVEFVYPDAVANYKLKVQDTLYKYLIDNTNKKRNQELPIVKDVEVSNIEAIDFKIQENSVKAYKISLSWTYEKDLGYDAKGTVIAVEKDNVLYVAEYVNE